MGNPLAGAGDGARISPTAHYTAYVWGANGLSDPALVTPLGAVLHTALAPLNALHRVLTGLPDLDAMLLARHRALDHLIERAVVAGRVGQVVEVAAGLTGRGMRFARRFPGLRWIEADLPAMAARKRQALDAAGLRGPKHEVVAVDALADAGPASLGALAARLDPGHGVALVTEGLVGYVDPDAVVAMWRRFAALLRGFPHGLYVSDLHLDVDVAGIPSVAVFRALLSAFSRGAVHLHFASAAAATAALRTAGFRDASVRQPGEVVAAAALPDGKRHLVWVLEAQV